MPSKREDEYSKMAPTDCVEDNIYIHRQKNDSINYDSNSNVTIDNYVDNFSTNLKVSLLASSKLTESFESFAEKFNYDRYRDLLDDVEQIVRSCQLVLRSCHKFDFRDVASNGFRTFVDKVVELLDYANSSIHVDNTKKVLELDRLVQQVKKLIPFVKSELNESLDEKFEPNDRNIRKLLTFVKHVTRANNFDAIFSDQERIKRLIEWSTSKIILDKRLPVKLYFRSGREMLRQANIYESERDDERAFQLYFRFVSLFVERVTEHPDYRTADTTEKSFFKSQCKSVLPKLEVIKKRLLNEYQRDFEKWLENEKKGKEEEEKQRAAMLNLMAHPSNNEVDWKSVQEKETIRRFQRAQEKMSNLLIKDNHEHETNQHHIPPTAPCLSPSHDNEVEEFECPPRVPSPTMGGAKFCGIPVPYLPSNKTVPSVDRSTKPSTSPKGSRRVVIPSSVPSEFLRLAADNTSRNVETCGVLCGRLQQDEFAITHVLIPKQRGTSDSCLTENEEELFAIQDEYHLTTLGWIHTHPSQSAFLSSIDLHTHFAYQVMLPEAIAIVCAPKFGDTGIFSLTPHYGLDYIANCTQTGFHPHQNESLLYESSPHVVLDKDSKANFIDLR